MKPLIKWPGGKSREFKNIAPYIPNTFGTYIEPFFGGGGVYFKLTPEKAIINDINNNLMSFYNLLKKEDKLLKKTLSQIAIDWDNITTIAKELYFSIKVFKNDIDKEKIKLSISNLRERKKLPNLINGQDKFWNKLEDGIIDKFHKIENLEQRNGPFSEKDFYNQIVAVAKGTYYYYLRDTYSPSTRSEDVAKFFFIREYCFGSMFRYNKDGKFNIPYGGASYNEKSFFTKINTAYSSATVKLLKNTKIYSGDFRNFFEKFLGRISENDFCFFDPPYDTQFSDYDKDAFGKKDQEDLAELFMSLKCKSLMIIKKTNFIYDLYKKQQSVNPRIHIKEYSKNYSYNVRGRNKRGVTHMLISNYALSRSNAQLSFLKHSLSAASV